MPLKSIQVRGLDEFNRAMRQLGPAAMKKRLRPVLLRGGEVLRDSTRDEARLSSDTGAMSRAIVAKLANRPDQAVAYMAVDSKLLKKVDRRGRRIRYPYIVEHGASPHTIKSQHGRALNIGGRAFVKSVKHPGFRGRKFFSRGVRRGSSRAKGQMETALKREIEALNGSTGATA